MTEIPDDLKINPKVKENMWHVFNNYKKKESANIEGRILIDFLKEYVKLYHFQIKIDPEILLKQVHLFYGNLLKIHNDISFEEMFKMFQYFVLASFEKLQGQTLLSSEILAFAYWKHHDVDKQGYFPIQDGLPIFKNFDFKIKNIDDFQNEFQFAISLHKNQFLFNKSKKLHEDNFLTFDFFRYIYLERNF